MRLVLCRLPARRPTPRPAAPRLTARAGRRARGGLPLGSRLGAGLGFRAPRLPAPGAYRDDDAKPPTMLSEMSLGDRMSRAVLDPSKTARKKKKAAFAEGVKPGGGGAFQAAGDTSLGAGVGTGAVGEHMLKSSRIRI